MKVLRLLSIALVAAGLVFAQTGAPKKADAKAATKAAELLYINSASEDQL